MRFLESKGFIDEAERVVAEFESSAALSTRTHADETASDNAPEAPANDAQEATSIWSAPLRKRTLALCAVWFCINLSYYGAFIWIPSLLSAQGFKPSEVLRVYPDHDLSAAARLCSGLLPD